MADPKELAAAAELAHIAMIRDHITALHSRITALESNLRDAEGRYEACYAELTRLQGEK